MKFREQLLIYLKYFGPVWLALCLFLFLVDYGEYSSAADAQNWRPVRVRIISSEVGLHQVSRGSYHYRPEIKYGYAVDGKNYEGDRLGFMFHGSFDSTSAGRLAAEHLAEALTGPAQAYYNPHDPTQSVLSIGHDYAKEFKQRTYGSIEAEIFAFILSIGLLIGWNYYCSLDDQPAYARSITTTPQPR